MAVPQTMNWDKGPIGPGFFMMFGRFAPIVLPDIEGLIRKSDKESKKKDDEIALVLSLMMY